jgi:hypothetical protein
MSTPPTRPGAPPSQPPRRYPFGGWVLYVLCLVYGLALWQATLLLLLHSQVAVYPLLVLAAVPLGLLAVDFRAYTSLGGNLRQLQGGNASHFLSSSCPSGLSCT